MMKNVIKRVLLTVMAIAVIFSSFGGLAFAQSKSITVMTNSTTVTNYETLTINEHGIESGSPGNATFTFTVETAGYYDMYMNMGFYWNISEVAGGNVGCNVDISLDSTERIYLSNENLEDLGVLTQMWHKNRFCYKIPVYLSVGQHTMTFTASERSGYANEFQLERFELVKNESILASPVPIKMITNKENAYSYSGLEFDNTSVATGNTGYVTYKFDVAQAAIYDLYMDMGFYMNLEASGDVGCDVSIQFDNETSNKLSEGNTVSVGVLSNAWHKNRFLYKKSVYLAQGNHSLTFTTTARSNKFSEFQLARFMLQASSKPAAIEVKTNAENVVSSKGFTVGVNGIETLDLGSATFQFNISTATFYDFVMNMGCYLNISEGCEVLVQFDQEEAVLITGDNVKDLTGKDVGYNKRNYQLKEPKFLPAGLHTVTFTTQQHGTQSPQFQLSNFVLTQTELPSHFAVKSSSKNIETKTVDVTFYVENGKAVDFVVIAAAYDGEVMQAVDFKTVEKMTNVSNQTVTLNLPGMTVNSKVKLYVWKSIGGAGALVPIFEKGDVQ